MNESKSRFKTLSKSENFQKVKKPWFVYIVRCKDNLYYVGITDDVPKRIKKHNLGIGSKYLISKTPITLLYTEEYPDKSSARKREIQLKGWSRKKKEWLIKIKTQLKN